MGGYLITNCDDIHQAEICATFRLYRTGCCHANDLSEDVREDINNLYQAIAELSARIEEKKKEPRTKIGFKQNTDD